MRTSACRWLAQLVKMGMLERPKSGEALKAAAAEAGAIDGTTATVESAEALLARKEVFMALKTQFRKQLKVSRRRC